MADKIIEPSIGRIMWYWSDNSQVQPWAAIVCYVHGPRLINVHGYYPDGGSFSMMDVTIRQPDDDVPGYPYVEWMPYQVGQAAKYEQLLDERKSE